MKLHRRSSVKSKAPTKIGPELNFAATEAYNFLRTNLGFSLPNKEGCKIIGITSSSPSEGKSFTSINLAYALAESGQKVLLVDGDMRRPTINRILFSKKIKGLSNYLVESENKIIRDGVLSENLSVITSGDTPPNPSELIGSNKMKFALDKLSQKFDYVILDLPPVSVVSDPLVVSKWLDGIIVVVKHDTTKTREITNTVKQLRYVNANIIGFVYNGFRIAEKTYKRRGYYGGSYRYSSYQSQDD